MLLLLLFFLLLLLTVMDTNIHTYKRLDGTRLRSQFARFALVQMSVSETRLYGSEQNYFNGYLCALVEQLVFELYTL